MTTSAAFNRRPSGHICFQPQIPTSISKTHATLTSPPPSHPILLHTKQPPFTPPRPPFSLPSISTFPSPSPLQFPFVPSPTSPAHSPLPNQAPHHSIFPLQYLPHGPTPSLTPPFHSFIPTHPFTPLHFPLSCHLPFTPFLFPYLSLSSHSLPLLFSAFPPFSADKSRDLNFPCHRASPPMSCLSPSAPA